jgi:hypothetical protein
MPRSTLSTHASAAIVAAALIAIGSASPRVASPAFFPDDPIERVPESQDASGVKEFEHSLAYGIIINTFARPGDPALDTRAANVNTIDEVPDSSWFTNRIIRGSRGDRATPLSVEDVARGPDVTGGPAPGPWTITRSKSEGYTPGFTIRDTRGVVWFLKFDPPGYLELSSGAEVVSTKLYHAAGYFVPENRIAIFRRDQLVVGEGARIRVGGSPPRAMTDRDVDRLLRLAARAADGSYRALASRAVEGRPVGPFSYYGRRSDDPNDVVPHEHRRELRGLRAMAAWTQHVDSKGGNSLDTLIDDNGRKRVRHHLIDLGSTLGSAGVKPRDYNEGYESLVEPGLIWRGILGFGFYIQPWHTIPYPDYPSIGRIESDHFEPDAWVPSVRNAAFLRARPDDLFWGARRVMAFTDEMIRAAVRTGQYSDPLAEQYLASVLIGRRDRIGRAWLPIVNPIVEPALGPSGYLTFVNAAVAAGVAKEPRGGYRAVWHSFDNATGQSTPLGTSNATNATLAPPRPLPLEEGAYVRVDVTAIDPPHPSWSVPVRLYFRRLPDAWKLAGLERGDKKLHTRDSAFTSTRDSLAMLPPWSCQSCNQGVFHDRFETSSALRVGNSFP